MLNVRKRLAWAQKYMHWRPEDREKVLWIDEALFTIFGGKNRPPFEEKRTNLEIQIVYKRRFSMEDGK